jgi:hypothetical protein
MSYDHCSFCNCNEDLYPTNSLSSRLHVVTVNANPFYCQALCKICVNEVDLQFIAGELPILEAKGIKFLVFGLPSHLYDVFQKYPSLKSSIDLSFRYINYIFMRISSENRDKKNLDFAGLLAHLEEENLGTEKGDLTEFLYQNYKRQIPEIMDITKKIIEWNKKSHFKINLVQ